MTAPPPRRRCSQTTASGKPCRNYAVHGSDRCASHLRLTGPKTTLTMELIERIAGFVRHGNHVSVACAAVGVPKQTFSDWWRRGAAMAETPSEILYSLLRERVAAAEAEGEARFAVIISRESEANVAWAAWLLERKWPERWARVSQRAEIPEAEEEDDPFREVDQLAEQRRRRQAER